MEPWARALTTAFDSANWATNRQEPWSEPLAGRIAASEVVGDFTERVVFPLLESRGRGLG